MASAPGDRNCQQKRREMVDYQLRRRGIRDPTVLESMERVPREAFVPEEQREWAYDDGPLPIGLGQTISAPFIVGRMIEAAELEPDDKVLEVGVGCGYAAAVMSRMVEGVWAIDRRPELAERSRSLLTTLGYHNVHVLCGDGSLGYPDEAPYDAIVVAAASPRVPDSLLEQLGPTGRMIIPVGRHGNDQTLIRLRNTPTGYDREDLEPVRFVPLVGREGWQAGP